MVSSSLLLYREISKPLDTFAVSFILLPAAAAAFLESSIKSKKLFFAMYAYSFLCSAFTVVFGLTPNCKTFAKSNSTVFFYPL